MAGTKNTKQSSEGGEKSEDRAAHWNRGRAVLEYMCNDRSIVKLTAKSEASVNWNV
jgi:hypothetical protein